MSDFITTMGFIDDGLEKRILPIQTMQSMADRWEVSIQVVVNWRNRDSEFPKPFTNLVVAKTQSEKEYYPLFEVERFEKLRGLIK